MNDEGFWLCLVDVQLIIDPLRIAITLIEGDIVDIVSAFKAIDHAFDEVSAAIIESKFSTDVQNEMLSVT